MFATFEAQSGKCTSLHGQVDQAPVGKVEVVDEKSFRWAPGSPILVVSEAHCSF